jgi:hypothetical protein
MFNESLDLISGSFRILFFDSSSLGWSPFGHGSTVTRSKRRFHAKTKPNNILALTAPTPAPCHPSLRCVCPVSAGICFCLAAAQVKDKNSLPGGTGD